MWCLVLYTLALLLSTMAEGMLIFMEWRSPLPPSGLNISGEKGEAVLLWEEMNAAVVLFYTVSIVITGSCGALVLVMHGRELAATRGFQEPLALSRSREGWVVSKAGGVQHSVLLGKIRIAKRTMQTLVHSAESGKQTSRYFKSSIQSSELEKQSDISQAVTKKTSPDSSEIEMPQREIRSLEVT